jgi:glycosyltransferase involved in cell wall biosynthesis
MLDLVMLAPRGFGDIAENEMVVARLEQYLQALDLISDARPQLTVLIGADEHYLSYRLQTEGRVRLLTISSQTRNSFKFAFLALKKSRRVNLRPRILIASDVRFAFLASLIYKLFTPSVTLQVQMHGMYESLSPNFLKYFRLPYLCVVAKFSDSIRFVSNDQYYSFPLVIRQRFRSTVIAPIPYFHKLSPGIVANNLNSIGFVGRLHTERGLDKYLEVIKEVNVSTPSKPIVIVGDGPEREEFFSNLRLNHSGPQIELGWLSSYELDAIWADIGTLLVSAPQESFGVAMREALLHGVKVVAFQNTATLAVEKQFPAAVFTSKLSSELAEKAIEWSTTRIDAEDWKRIYKLLHEEEQESLLKIAKSWTLRV